MAKANTADGQAGHGDLWLSRRPGHLGELIRIVSSDEASRVRTDGSLAVGVSVIKPIAGGWLVGTVNEGESAEMFRIDTRHPAWRARFDAASRVTGKGGGAAQGYGCRAAR